MSSKVPISILRTNSEEWPKREDCVPGQIVVMTSGDMMVWSGYMWFLLPSRLITIDELKEFIGYVQSGWPSEPAEILRDLGESITDKTFLHRAMFVCGNIGKEGGLPAPPL